MALPTTISSVRLGQAAYHHGPYISSGGNVYIAVLTSAVIDIYKATDPTDSFTIQDAGNSPTGSSQQCVWVDQDSDVLRIVTVESSGSVADEGVDYHDFNMADDTWGTTNDHIVDFTGQNPPLFRTNRTASITHRGAGDPIVCLHVNNADKLMGTNYERVEYSTRSGGGTWTNQGLAFGAATDEISYIGTSAVTGTSNGTHFFSNDKTSLLLLARTLNSSNSLSTTISHDPTATNVRAHPKCVTYDDSGTQRMLLPFTTNTNGPLSIWRTAEDGSNDVSHTDSFVISDTGNDPRSTSDTLTAAVAMDGTTSHVIWGDDTDFDVYHDEADAPQASGDWGTDVEERDAVSAPTISGNIFTRSGTKFAFSYSDGTDVFYDELDIAVAGGGQVWPSPVKQMAHLLNR